MGTTLNTKVYKGGYGLQAHWYGAKMSAEKWYAKFSTCTEMYTRNFGTLSKMYTRKIGTGGKKGLPILVHMQKCP